MAQYKTGLRQTDDGTVSERVVAAVADARDVDPMELPPLYEVLDPDALNDLFAPGHSACRTGPGRVVFMLAGCEVVVHSDGEVAVTAPGDRSPTSAPTTPAGRDEAESKIE